MLPFVWPLHPLESLVESALWFVGALFITHGLLRLPHSNVLIVSLIWFFLIAPLYVPLLAPIWGGDFVWWIYGHRVIWAGIHFGWTYEFMGIGFTDLFFPGFGRVELVRYRGSGLPLDETHLALLLVLGAGYWLYHHPPQLKR